MIDVLIATPTHLLSKCVMKVVKGIQKIAPGIIVLLSLSALLRPELSHFAPTSINSTFSPQSTVSDDKPSSPPRPQVVPMTEENNPALFRDTFCDLEGLSSSSPPEWQLRTPYFLLGGSKKCATTSLSNYLNQHSQLKMARRKELLFFLPSFEKNHVNNATGKVLVNTTRNSMYTRDYNAKLMQQNSSLLAFEGTPGYMFYSTRAPKYILCSIPWVKMVFILRNPVDRLWSNYNFLNKGDKISFEAWVKQDMTLLKRMGILPKNRHSSEFVGSDQEYVAWDRYLKKCREGPVGRSMYIVQLLHWYKAFRAIGRDPSQEILVVRNEDLNSHPQETLDKIHKWLGVPLQELKMGTKKFMTSRYKVGNLSDTTRQELEDFYRPYNQRLYDLLGGDWQGVWESPVNGGGDGNQTKQQQEQK